MYVTSETITYNILKMSIGNASNEMEMSIGDASNEKERKKKKYRARAKAKQWKRESKK